MTSNVTTKDDINNLSSLITNILKRLTNIETRTGDKVEELEGGVLELEAKNEALNQWLPTRGP